MVAFRKMFFPEQQQILQSRLGIYHSYVFQWDDGHGHFLDAASARRRRGAWVSSGAVFHSLMRSESPVAGRSRRAETSWDTKALEPKATPSLRRCTMGCSCSATSGPWAGRIFSRARRLRCNGSKAASAYLKSCASSADYSFS